MRASFFSFSHVKTPGNMQLDEGELFEARRRVSLFTAGCQERARTSRLDESVGDNFHTRKKKEEQARLDSSKKCRLLLLRGEGARVEKESGENRVVHETASND